MGGFRITYLYLYPYIYIILYIFLYCVRVTLTLKDGRWMRRIRWSKDGKFEHYWPLDIIQIPPDFATCIIQKTPWLNLSIMHKHQNAFLYPYIVCEIFERWSLDEANPTVQRWQIRAQLSVGYHQYSIRFCHMYTLEDSMVELKHNAQTSKQHGSPLFQNLPYHNCPNFFSS